MISAGALLLRALLRMQGRDGAAGQRLAAAQVNADRDAAARAFLEINASLPQSGGLRREGLVSHRILFHTCLLLGWG